MFFSTFNFLALVRISNIDAPGVSSINIGASESSPMASVSFL